MPLNKETKPNQKWYEIFGLYRLFFDFSQQVSNFEHRREKKFLLKKKKINKYIYIYIYIRKVRWFYGISTLIGISWNNIIS